VNPGFLKIDLVLRGAALDPGLRGRPDLLGDPGDEQALDLVLPGELWVRAPLVDGAAAGGAAGRPPFVVQADGDRLVVADGATVPAAAGGAEPVEVRVNPTPGFYGRTTSRGTPMHRVATVHGSAISVQPAAACGFGWRGGPCAACREGVRAAAGADQAPAVADVVEVVRAAFDEGAAEFVHFNTTFTRTEDGGVAFLEPYVEAVKRHFDTLVAAQAHPPRTHKWIDRTYAMGIDALSYNLELFDAGALERWCPGRVREIGRERYLDALGYAASILPSGTVWSDLVVGLEPASATAEGIDALAALGVVPVLALAPPAATGGAGVVPSAEAIAPLCARLYTATKERRVSMGWLRGFGAGLTPLEARFFVGEDARLTVAVQSFYRSRFGSLTARSLARFRRRLRVRAVSDSFDSSGL
jgi:hypothetical protein